MKKESNSLDNRGLCSKLIVCLGVVLITVFPTFLVLSLSDAEVELSRLPIAFLILFFIVALTTTYLLGYDIDNLTQEQKETSFGRAIGIVGLVLHKTHWVIALITIVVVGNLLFDFL